MCTLLVLDFLFFYKVPLTAEIYPYSLTLSPLVALPVSDGSQLDHLFSVGEEFAIGGIGARVIAVPGHTSDSVAYRVGDALFTGDSLFMPDGGTARCDF